MTRVEWTYFMLNTEKFGPTKWGTENVYDNLLAIECYNLTLSQIRDLIHLRYICQRTNQYKPMVNPYTFNYIIRQHGHQLTCLQWKYLNKYAHIMAFRDLILLHGTYLSLTRFKEVYWKAMAINSEYFRTDQVMISYLVTCDSYVPAEHLSFLQQQPFFDTNPYHKKSIQYERWKRYQENCKKSFKKRRLF